MPLLASQISNRLSLRIPQRESLELLANACDHLSLTKEADPSCELAKLQKYFPHVRDFERSFPSLCFSLATGVGKTRLMGAFIAYLSKVKQIKHFLILAPNLTVYDKLRRDFSPGNSKYVLDGLAEFATTPPVIIDGENWVSGRGVRVSTRIQPEFDLFRDKEKVHINIFNIAKLHSGAGKREIKAFKEYLGVSYFEYLSTLSDLVVLNIYPHSRI